MIALNLTANVFGLGNAATPFGIKAMEELQKLNPSNDTATNPMVMMLALNTASVQLVPPVLLLALLGLQINQLVFPIIGTGFVGLCVAIASAKLLGRLPRYRATDPNRAVHAATETPWIRDAVSLLSVFVVPIILVGFPLYGLYKRVPVYEKFVEGAKEGFQVAVRIIPYLVAILFAIAMFRASGAMDFLARALAPVLGPLGFPPEVLPMAIIRPLTGSGSAGIVVDMIRPVRRGLDPGEDGGGDVRIDRDDVLCHRGLLRRGEHPEDPARGTGGPAGRRRGDARGGVDGAAAVRLTGSREPWRPHRLARLAERAGLAGGRL